MDEQTNQYQDFIPQGEEGGSPYVNGQYQDFVPAPEPRTDVEVPTPKQKTDVPAQEAPAKKK